MAAHRVCRACGGALAVTMADLGLQPAVKRLPAALRASAQREALSAARQGVRVLQARAGGLRRPAAGTVRQLRLFFLIFGGLARARAALTARMARERFALDCKEPRGRARQQRRLPAEEVLAAGMPVLGIDPSDTVAAAAERIGVPTLGRIFRRSARRAPCRDRDAQADLIIANNVLAHVPQLNDFVAGIATLLKPHGSARSSFRICCG